MPMINSVFDAGDDNVRLSTAQASNYLGFSRKTLANWAYQGLGPTSFKVGGRRFYRLGELKKFIRSSPK